jgi:hypothetical protein
MPQSQPPKNYLTAGEVKKLLGITDGMLYNFIDNGALKRVIPPGRKQGVYHRSQVEQLARDLQVFISTRDEDRTTFRRARKDDIPKYIAIGAASYPITPQQERTIIEKHQCWLDKNPNLYFVIEHDNEIVGYTSIIPLKPKKIKEILDSKEPAMDVTVDEIEDFKPGRPLHIYIATMRTKPNISKTQKRAYGTRLLGGLITTIVDMLENDINIHTLYAKSETVDGIRALKHMEFVEIPSVTDSKNYILELGKEYGKAAIKKYKRIAHHRAATQA